MSTLARNDERTASYGQKTETTSEELGHDYGSTASHQWLRLPAGQFNGVGSSLV